jgi:hypothetical protein
MMSVPYQAGFSPKRGHQVADVMLEKEPGNSKQHRLHIVALLESDFNQSQRILLARRLIHHMEDAELMSEMQYGSRPSKMCINPVINKVVSFNLVRQTKVNGAFIETTPVAMITLLITWFSWNCITWGFLSQSCSPSKSHGIMRVIISKQNMGIRYVHTQTPKIDLCSAQARDPLQGHPFGAYCSAS